MKRIALAVILAAATGLGCDDGQSASPGTSDAAATIGDAATGGGDAAASAPALDPVTIFANTISLAANQQVTGVDAQGRLQLGNVLTYATVRGGSQTLLMGLRKVGANCVAYEGIDRFNSDPEARASAFTISMKKSGYQVRATLVGDEYRLQAVQASNQPDKSPYAADDEVTIVATFKNGTSKTVTSPGPVQVDVATLFPDGARAFDSLIRVPATALPADGVVVSNVGAPGGKSGLSCYRRRTDLTLTGDAYTGPFLPPEAIAEIRSKGFSETTTGGFGSLYVGRVGFHDFSETRFDIFCGVLGIRGLGCGSFAPGAPSGGAAMLSLIGMLGVGLLVRARRRR